MCMTNINGVKVSSVKDDYVQALINSVERKEGATSLILYGSVLEERCSEESDVNIVITGSLEEVAGYHLVSSVYDDGMDYDLDQDVTALYYKDGSPEIAHYLEKGKVVWKRGN